jgi:outer membrane protein assembly factor BamB
MLGGVETPIAYANETLFIPVVNLSTELTSTGLVGDSSDLSQATGELVALNVRDGSLRWKVDLAQGAFGGATVANDIVFVSTIDGQFSAYQAETGEQIWGYRAQAGFNAPPAIAGDLVVVAAAGPRIPSAAEEPPPPVPLDVASLFGAPEPTTVLIAFRLSS